MKYKVDLNAVQSMNKCRILDIKIDSAKLILKNMSSYLRRHPENIDKKRKYEIKLENLKKFQKAKDEVLQNVERL